MAFEAASLVTESLMGSGSGFTISHLFHEQNQDEEEIKKSLLSLLVDEGTLEEFKRQGESDGYTITKIEAAGSAQGAPTALGTAHGPRIAPSSSSTTIKHASTIPSSGGSSSTVNRTTFDTPIMGKSEIKSTKQSGNANVLSCKSNRPRKSVRRPLSPAWVAIFSGGFTMIASATIFFIWQTVAIHIKMNSNYS